MAGTTLPFGDPNKPNLDNFNPHVNQEERIYSSLDSNSRRLFEMDYAGTPVNEERSMNFVEATEVGSLAVASTCSHKSRTLNIVFSVIWYFMSLW